MYPSLILANAARQSGIEAFIFFTFWGLDAITEKKVDHLHVNLAGNASSVMPRCRSWWCRQSGNRRIRRGGICWASDR